jgi:hypothetical protein
MQFVIVTVTALVTRMKQVSEKRERLAAREEERKEKEEKWKHGHIQEKGKKQNPKDAWKRKVRVKRRYKYQFLHYLTCRISFPSSLSSVPLSYFSLLPKKRYDSEGAKLLATPVRLAVSYMTH